MMTETLELDLSELYTAHKKISPYIHKTPIQSASYISKRLGIDLNFKCENLQKTGSFKVRGALHKLKNLDTFSRMKGVIAVSAGNHGQALAWASNLLDIPCTIVMPETSSKAKIDASKEYGADVILHGNFEQAYEKAKQIEQDQNLTFVHPFDDLEIVLGQGTMWLEIISKLKEVDIIVASVGGGGLVSGLAFAAKSINPKIKVYGVEPLGANSMRTSLDKGYAVEKNPVNTIADGLATPMAGKLTYELVKKYVDDIITVDDAQIGEAVKTLLIRYKLLTEPAGAAAFAALYCEKIPFKPNDKIVTILSGGNTDMNRLKSLL